MRDEVVKELFVTPSNSIAVEILSDKFRNGTYQWITHIPPPSSRSDINGLLFWFPIFLSRGHVEGLRITIQPDLLNVMIKNIEGENG